MAFLDRLLDWALPRDFVPVVAASVLFVATKMVERDERMPSAAQICHNTALQVDPLTVLSLEKNVLSR